MTTKGDFFKRSEVFVCCLVSLFVLLTLLCLPAHATQTHKAPEGLYVHQMGHLLFLLAAAFLAVRLHRNPLLKGKGWSRIKIACWLFVAWNLYAITCHTLEELMPAQPFVGTGSPWFRTLAEVPAGLGIAYYAFKFDHLICVPAIVFFFLGLRALAGDEK